MDHQRAHHAHRHRHLVGVRVVHERALVLHLELVDEGLADRDMRLGETADAVHAVRKQDPVPVDRGVLRQLVGDEDAHLVALDALDRRTGRLAVVAPGARSCRARAGAAPARRRRWNSFQPFLMRQGSDQPFKVTTGLYGRPVFGKSRAASRGYRAATLRAATPRRLAKPAPRRRGRLRTAFLRSCRLPYFGERRLQVGLGEPKSPQRLDERLHRRRLLPGVGEELERARRACRCSEAEPPPRSACAATISSR